MPGKLWALERENNGERKHFCCQPLPSQKKYFFVPGKNHVEKNVFAHNSRASLLVCGPAPLSLFSLQTPLPACSYTSSQPFLTAFLALLAPGHLHSHSQARLLHQLPLTLSGSLGFPCVSVLCIFCLLFQLFGVSDEFTNFFIPSDRTQEPPQI